MLTEQFDKIIIGAGLYGLYSALFCSRLNQKILFRNLFGAYWPSEERK